MNNLVKWIKTTSTKFSQLSNKNDNAIYFLEDTAELYKGNTSYTKSVVFVDSFPSVGAVGKLYVDNSSLQTKVWTGSEWKELKISSSSTTPSGHVEIADAISGNMQGKAVSGEAVKNYVLEQLKTINTKTKISNESGNLVEEKSDGIFVGNVKTEPKVSNPTADDVLISNTDGSIKCSGRHLSEFVLGTDITTSVDETNPSEQKIVSEKALIGAMSWIELK